MHRQNIEGRIIQDSDNMITPALEKIFDKGSSENTATESDAQREQKLSDRDLPDEIWDEIMTYMDIFDLTNLRRVSTRWLAIADRVSKRESKWYEKCVDDIPKKYWSSILEHHANPKLSCNAYHESKIHSHVWISMYNSWLGWNSLLDKEIRQKTIDVSPPECEASIGALSASGKLLAVGVDHDGTYYRHVDVYDIGNFNEGPIYTGDQITGDLNSGFRSIHVCQKDTEILVVCRGDQSGSAHYWHVAPSSSGKPDVLTDVDDNKHSEFYVSASLGYCYTLRRAYTFSEVADGPAHDTVLITLSIDRLSTAMDSRENQFTLPERDPMGYHQGIVGDGDKVLILSAHQGGNILKIKELCPDSGELRKISTINSMPYNHVDFEICNPCVVTFLNGSEIGFSVAGRPFKSYNTHRDLNLMSKVTVYLYHIGLLILGFETGEICIINIKDVDGLENLCLKTMRHKFVKLDSCDNSEERGVDFLAVTEHNSIQYIVAGTYDKIHLIEFH